MSEFPDNGTPDGLAPGQLLPSGVTEEGFEDTGLQQGWEELRAAYGGWLERRGVNPATVPHFTMSQREFDLFRNVPRDYLGYTRRIYGISGDDQDNYQYALVEIVDLADPTVAHEPELMDVTDADFGTTIDRSLVDEDFLKADPDMPDLSGGALRTVNIAPALATSGQNLQMFAETVMSGETTNPFSSDHGDIGVRAGGIADGQRDAYVWRESPFTKSVELTLAFPTQYKSVCVVRGRWREAANGKPHMAQIEGPEIVLKIEGENLQTLQEIYRDLYHEPDFALTEVQRQQRDERFNTYLINLISDEASRNRAQEDAQRRTRQQPLRARQLPLS